MREFFTEGVGAVGEAGIVHPRRGDRIRGGFGPARYVLPEPLLAPLNALVGTCPDLNPLGLVNSGCRLIQRFHK